MEKELGDRLDRFIMLGGFWPVLGAIWDSYHHAQGAAETFWSVQHAVIYSGILVLGAGIFYLIFRSWQDEGSFIDSIPEGYELGILGIGILVMGGIGDMLWHTAFGVEQGILEIGSASHLLLVVGALFLAATSLRRAWYIGVDKSWKGQLPMLTSTAFFLTFLSYLLWAVHPLVTPYLPIWSGYAGNKLALLTGVIGILMYGSILSGVFLQLSNRFDLVSGSLVYVMALQMVLITIPSELFIFIPAGILTGVFAEFNRIYFSPGIDGSLKMRFYSISIPMFFALSYLITVLLYGGTWWNIHEISALIVLPGIGGGLVSYLLCPSAKVYKEKSKKLASSRNDKK